MNQDLKISETTSRLNAAINFCPIIASGLRNNRITETQAVPMRAFVAWVESQAAAEPSLNELAARLRSAIAAIPAAES